MKQLSLICFALLFALTTLAQTRRPVRMPERPFQHAYRNTEMENQGIWFAIEGEGATSIMATSRNLQIAELSFTGGYRLSEYLKVGVGFGAKGYINHADLRRSDNVLAFPIYANLRGNFLSAYHRGYSPYWSVNVGGVINDGFYFNPTIGYSIGGLRNNFLVGLSYTLSNFEDYASKNRVYSYLGLKLGYEF